MLSRQPFNNKHVNLSDYTLQCAASFTLRSLYRIKVSSIHLAHSFRLPRSHLNCVCLFFQLIGIERMSKWYEFNKRRTCPSSRKRVYYIKIFLKCKSTLKYHLIHLSIRNHFDYIAFCPSCDHNNKIWSMIMMMMMMKKWQQIGIGLCWGFHKNQMEKICSKINISLHLETVRRKKINARNYYNILFVSNVFRPSFR